MDHFVDVEDEKLYKLVSYVLGDSVLALSFVVHDLTTFVVCVGVIPTRKVFKEKDYLQTYSWPSFCSRNDFALLSVKVHVLVLVVAAHWPPSGARVGK